MTVSFEFIRLYGPYRLSTTKCTRCSVVFWWQPLLHGTQETLDRAETDTEIDGGRIKYRVTCAHRTILSGCPTVLTDFRKYYRRYQRDPDIHIRPVGEFRIRSISAGLYSMVKRYWKKNGNNHIFFLVWKTWDNSELFASIIYSTRPSVSHFILFMLGNRKPVFCVYHSLCGNRNTIIQNPL